MIPNLRPLYEQILATIARHEWETRPRHGRWIQVITQVNRNWHTNQAITGPYLKRGNTPVANKPTLFLAKSSPGGRLPQDAQYHIVVMDADGNLRVLDDPNLPNPGYPYTAATIAQLLTLLAEMKLVPNPQPRLPSLSLQARQNFITRIAAQPPDAWASIILYVLEGLAKRIEEDAYTLFLETLANDIDIRVGTGMW